jgi:hypothetical protein
MAFLFGCKILSFPHLYTGNPPAKSGTGDPKVLMKLDDS